MTYPGSLTDHDAEGFLYAFPGIGNAEDMPAGSVVEVTGQTWTKHAPNLWTCTHCPEEMSDRFVDFMAVWIGVTLGDRVTLTLDGKRRRVYPA